MDNVIRVIYTDMLTGYILSLLHGRLTLCRGSEIYSVCQSVDAYVADELYLKYLTGKTQ